MALSNETYDIGRLFFHSIRLQKKSDLLHFFPTHEIDYPYRWSKSLIVRFPGTTRGLVVGWWRNTSRTEDEAVLAGMQGRDMSYQEYLEEAMKI